MKFLGVAFLFGLIAISACTAEELEESLKKFQTECIAESGISEDLAHKAEGGHFEEDAKSKAYFLCFMMKAGFMGADGKYNIDLIKKSITEKYDEATAEKYIAECTKEDSGNPEDNAFHMVKCYHEHVKH